MPNRFFDDFVQMACDESKVRAHTIKCTLSFMVSEVISCSGQLFFNRPLPSFFNVDVAFQMAQRSTRGPRCSLW